MTLDWLRQLRRPPGGPSSATSRTRRRRPRWPRSPPRGQRRAGRRDGRRLGARALVDREGLPAARARAAQGAGRRRVPPPRRRSSTSAAPARWSRRSGRRRRRSVDPVPAIADALRRGRCLAARRRGVRRRGGRLPRAARPVRRLGAGRLDRRQPAQVAGDADGLLGAVDAPGRGLPRAFSLVPEYLRSPRRRVQPERGLGAARPPLPSAEAVGGAALLRPRRACRSTSASTCRLAQLFAGWVRDEPGWDVCAPAPFSLVCFRLDADDDVERGAAGAGQRVG